MSAACGDGARVLRPERATFEQIGRLVPGAVPDDGRKSGLQDIRRDGVPHPAQTRDADRGARLHTCLRRLGGPVAVKRASDRGAGR